MSEEKIITFDGTVAPEGAKCKKIKGEYYIENQQCFRINGKWYRINSGFIGYNLDTKQWDLLENMSNLQAVLHATNQMGYTKEYNEFEYIPFNSKAMGKGFATNEEVLIASGLVECKDGSGFGDTPKDSNGINNYQFELQYSLKDNPKYLTFIKKAKKLSGIANNKEKAMAVLAGDHSWGVENESKTGIIAPFALGKYGIVPLKDGSINGVEYATLPMQGEDGAMLTDKIFTIFSERLQHDHKCSVHIHIGNIDKNNYYEVLAIYYLCWRIQSEIFEILPNYKRDAEYFQHVKKDYAKPLRKLIDGKSVTKDPKSLKTAFQALWNWMTENQGVPVGSNDFKAGQQKWNFNSRYFWVNFLNLYFGSGTVEFRCFPPTVNKKRLNNYLVLSLAIVRYALAFPEQIFSTSKIGLTDVVEAIGNNFGKGGNAHLLQISHELLGFINQERAHYDACSWEGKEKYEHYKQWDSK